MSSKFSALLDHQADLRDDLRADPLSEVVDGVRAEVEGEAQVEVVF